jgi:hypothetical protein
MNKKIDFVFEEEPVNHKRYYRRHNNVNMTYSVDRYDKDKRRYLFFGFINARSKKLARLKVESIGDRNNMKLRVYGVGFISSRDHANLQVKRE